MVSALTDLFRMCTSNCISMSKPAHDKYVYVHKYFFRILHCTGSIADRIFTLHNKNCQKFGLHVEREKNLRLKVSCNQISNLSQLFAQENQTNVLVYFQPFSNFSQF